MTGVLRLYKKQNGGLTTIRIPPCTCTAPRMLSASILNGVCGNCGGARGPDCPENNPIVSTEVKSNG